MYTRRKAIQAYTQKNVYVRVCFFVFWKNVMYKTAAFVRDNLSKHKGPGLDPLLFSTLGEII